MATASENTVQSFYLAYYGRPADPGGLEYWAGRLDAEGSFDSLVAAFGVSAEATELYAGMTEEQQVNGIYQSLFGRDADAEGLAFYLAGLADGSFTLQDISKRVLDGATTGDDAAYIANKITVATAFTDELAADPELAAEYVGLAATTSAKAIISAVDATEASVTAANASILASFSITSTDLTSAADSITGGAGRDRISASVSNAGGTLQVTDVIDGGAGTDRLSVDMSIDFAGFSSGSVTNVEKIYLTNLGGTARTFDSTGISGATTYNLNGTNAGFVLTDVPTGTKTIELAGQTTGALTTSFANGSSETGAASLADAMTLDLTDVGGSTAATAIDVTLGSIETINVVSHGTNNIDILGSENRTLNVSGDGATTIRTVSSATTAFDASAATGKVTATLTNAAASALKSVKAGSGDDTITVASGDLPSTATLSGGDGTDTLSFSTAGATTGQYTMSGFETLSISSTSGALTFLGSNVSGLGAVTTVAAVAGAVTFTDMPATALTFTSSGATADAGDVTSDHSGDTTLNFSALAATTSARTVTAGIDPSADYTFSSSTGTLTVNVNDLVDVANSTVTAAKVGQVVLNVASGKNTSGTELTEFNSTITAATASTVTVNATGILGSSAAISAAKATSATIVNGSNPGVLATNMAALTSLDITTGANLSGMDASTTLTKLQTLDVTANKGIVTFGNAMVAARSIALDGAGTTSEVVLGALGQVSNGYGLSLTASGLAGGGTAASPDVGLTVGNITVATGFDVDINTSGMTGSATIGTITSSGTTDIPKNISVNAAGQGGLITVGNVLGSGTVTLNAKAAYDAAFGTVTGGNVVVDISATSQSSAVGNITATTSVDATYQTAVANTQTILGSATSTALSVDVTGGALVDTITINGGGAQKSITVTGSLGASSDVLTVNNTASMSTATSINISGLESYDAATLTTNEGAQLIVGGGGVDQIIAGANASTAGDTLTGGAGNDSFWFNFGDSPYSAPDTITDFASGDEIALSGVSSPSFTSGTTAVTGTASAAALDAYGVVTFATLTTAPASLTAAVTLVESVMAHAAGTWAFFEYGGVKYLYVADGTDGLGSGDLVIGMTGITFPSANLVDANTTGSGISGFGG